MGEGAEEEPGSTHEDRHPAPVTDGGDPAVGLPGERAGRVAPIGIHQVQAVVRNPAALDHRKFGGPDVHAAVHLSGIHRHDFPVQPACHRHCQFALPRSGGTYDGKDLGIHRPNFRASSALA